MSKINPFLQQVVHLVADFLLEIGHAKEASKLKTQFELPDWVQKDNLLIKKGLKKIIKQFINSNQKVLKYCKARKPFQQEQSQDEDEEKIRSSPIKKNKKSLSPKMSPAVKPKSPKVSHVQELPVKKTWMTNQFQQPKRLEDLNYDLEEKQVQLQVDVPKSKQNKKQTKLKSDSQQSSEQSSPVVKKKQKQIKKSKKTKKVKGPVDSSYLNSEEQFQLQARSKRSKTPERPVVEKKIKHPIVENHVVTRKKSTQLEENHNAKVNIPVKNSIENKNTTNTKNQLNQGQKQFFSRINHDQVGFIPQNRRDNTFEAKARYGAGDSWGQFGHEKLKDTRGDSFKKTKGKLKNKAFQGSGININQINSVPIL